MLVGLVETGHVFLVYGCYGCLRVLCYVISALDFHA